jgi:hypothetical protein
MENLSPLGLVTFRGIGPRVGPRASVQPWAMGRNPVGILRTPLGSKKDFAQETTLRLAVVPACLARETAKVLRSITGHKTFDARLLG